MRKSAFDIEQQNKDLSDKIVVGLERISEAFRVLLWDHAKKIGLSPIQIQLLIFLKYHAETLRNVSALALEFNMTKPTISDAIKMLDQKGLVQKSPGITDARSSIISLTSEGEKMVESVSSFASPIGDNLKQLDQKKLDSFYKSLVHLIYQLNQSGVISTQRTCFGCRFYEQRSKVHYCHFLRRDLSDTQIRLDCKDFVQATDQA